MSAMGFRRLGRARGLHGLVAMTHLLESAPASSWLPLTGALLIATAALTGCGDGIDPECDGCGPTPSPTPNSTCVADAAPAAAPAIVPGLSVGPDSFSELTDDGVIALQFGGQGGTHVDVSARTFVDAGTNLTVAFEIESPDWNASTEVAGTSCASGEWAQVTGRVFDPPSGEVTLRVTILEGGNEIAMTEMPASIQ